MIVFIDGKLEESPEESVVMKFPGFKLTILIGKQRVYAELLEGSRRKVFVGHVRDEGEEVGRAVEKVLENLSKVVRFDHKK